MAFLCKKNSHKIWEFIIIKFNQRRINFSLCNIYNYIILIYGQKIKKIKYQKYLTRLNIKYKKIKAIKITRIITNNLKFPETIRIR